MKILIIINNLAVGGAEHLVVDEINELIRRGVDVKLFTLKKEYEKSLFAQCQMAKENWQMFPFKNDFDFRQWFRLMRAISACNPDLIITHLWWANTIGRIAAHLVGKKNTVSFEHNIYDNVKTSKMFFTDKALQFWCKKIIAVSNAVKENLLKHGIQKKRIDVVFNGINVKKYQDMDRMKARKILRINEADFVFLFVGRLIYQKAVDVLIEAFSKAGSGKLFIVGQGADRKNLEELSDKLGALDKISFLGVRNDIPEILAASDCFVLPSRYEGLGIVVIEAMASGKPIVISDFDAGKEMVVDGENGLVVHREDVEGLSSAMKRIFNDGYLRARLSESAKKSVEKFSIEKHVDAIMKYTR